VKAFKPFPRRQRALLEAYVETGQVVSACKAARVCRSDHYKWMKTDRAYAEAFELADEMSADLLEDEVLKRAKDGVVEAVFYQGKPVGARRIYSDGLAMFLLQGKRPQKYRQNQKVELTGPRGGPQQHEITITFVRAAQQQ
jgi:hypothetical protein